MCLSFCKCIGQIHHGALNMKIFFCFNNKIACQSPLLLHYFVFELSQLSPYWSVNELKALLKLEPSISISSTLLMDSRSKLFTYIKKSGIIFLLWHIKSILQTHYHLVHLSAEYNHRPVFVWSIYISYSQYVLSKGWHISCTGHIKLQV